MSKRKIAYQLAGGVIGLVGLNLALAPSSVSAKEMSSMPTNVGGCCGNMSNGTGGNMSNGTGGNMSNGTGGNMSHGTGACPKAGDCNTNISNGSGMGNGSNTTGGECKTSPCPPGTKDPKDPKNPFENGSTTSGADPKRGDYIIGKNNFSQFDGGGKGGNNYGGSSAGLSRQMMELLNAASNAYAEASARLAAIQSQATPSAQKDTSVRYSRVADANADCGCNASASVPDNSVELAAAKKAEAEAAASLAKAQQQAREFLEAQKKSNLANGTQFTPIW